MPAKRIGSNFIKDPLYRISISSLSFEDNFVSYLPSCERLYCALRRRNPSTAPGVDLRIIKSDRCPVGNYFARRFIQGCPDILQGPPVQNPSPVQLTFSPG